ncbi:amidase [Streptomyces albipurpureus]|uniref:Amidase family protein n=1 Tax=Streptomyces albipurpureus TaxID=2897419 RepID=A0ABT0UZU9_9ACTN|nr:amidase family protein [Streptomyces sp. CWNU-1]MCM2394108.1 amidase family protein [Streptomyces sp. CWNU-1]
MTAAPQDIHLTSATELARLIRRRELSPVELMEGVIDRIEERNPLVNAFVYQGFDQARERARNAERMVLNGAELGALHGVPTAMKDLYDFKPGWISTLGGVRALAGNVSDGYCVWAERMEQAGAIIVGKTNSPVLGFGGLTDNPLFGPTANPFDLSRNAGGSSGGSAAAVADGMVPFAEGTDAGGSIRTPSAWCGVYGLKPSAGRVPAVKRPNAFGATNPFTHEGVITRNVRDAAVGLGILSGVDARDPFSVGGPTDFTPDLHRDVRGWRIAFSPDFGGYPITPEVAAVVERAAARFERAGATVERVDLDLGLHHRELSELFNRIIAVQYVEATEHLKASGIDLLAEHPDDLPPALRECIVKGLRLTAPDIALDQRLRSQIYDTVQDVFHDHRLLITPTGGTTAVPNATTRGTTMGPEYINGEAVDRYRGWCLTYLINLTGHPAASIPAGLTGGGLPVGLQLIGRRHHDGDVIAASSVFEELQPWHHTYPAHPTRSPRSTAAAAAPARARPA